MSDISFICPQDGETEREFKQKLLFILFEYKNIEKAYLALIRWNSLGENGVALCLEGEKINEMIINVISKIFREMFNSSQSIDIIILNEIEKKQIRLFCPPFFNRNLKEFNHPDFYLSSTEWSSLTSPKKCWCIRQLNYGDRDDLILVHLDPILIYQDKIEGEIQLNQVILAGRHAGYPIFPLKNWPIYVYIVKIRKSITPLTFSLEKMDIENLAWGELSKKT